MIHFVGAGCGAPDLITVRGARLLSEADVVIYAGSLVNPALLDYCKEGCEIHDSAYMTLEEVIETMKEQFDALDPLGIEYDVCPGVSAFSGAAASLKAEYTLPNVSQTVMITRMEGRTPVPDKEKIRSLAQHQTTMCLFLSTGLLEGLQAELMAGGFSPDTPAAIVYKASWPEEKIVRCRLCEIAQKATENHITKTALIVVGYFLGDNYDRSKLYDPGFTTEFREATK